MSCTKTLRELKVTELKVELENRELETTGTKSILQNRLANALKAAGEDPESFLFEMNEYNWEAFEKLRKDFEGKTRILEEKLLENMEQKITQNNILVREEIEEKMSKNVEKIEEKFVKSEEKLLNLLEEKLKVFDFPTEKTKMNTAQDPQGIARVTTVREPPGKGRVKPPTFDGTSSWPNYLKQFKAAATANGWSGTDCATALILSLRGNAVDVLETIPIEEQANFEQIVKRLETRYGQKHLEDVYFTMLKNRAQKPGESLQELEADISRLVRLSNPDSPESFMERIAIRYFIEAIHDAETQQALRLARPKTLADTLSQALDFEAAKRASKRDVRVRALQPDLGTSNEKYLEAMIERLLDARKSNIKRRQPRCWNCGELGHVRSRCDRPVTQQEEKPVYKRSSQQGN
ncbi:hypothetical protein R5R35_003954 [Gryllus longicercus]|uniref:CCHC-type domain-containing protein n=1 Tax=Gryllus longicercus TaxID=2509291 RepID=A0AAN9Z0X8_9ORTH